MTNGENPAAEGALGFVNIVSYKFQPQVDVFPVPVVFLSSFISVFLLLTADYAWRLPCKKKILSLGDRVKHIIAILTHDQWEVHSLFGYWTIT